MRGESWPRRPSIEALPTKEEDTQTKQGGKGKEWRKGRWEEVGQERHRRSKVRQREEGRRSQQERLRRPKSREKEAAWSPEERGESHETVAVKRKRPASEEGSQSGGGD